MKAGSVRPRNLLGNMITRYHIQVDGEESPRGPLPAAAVRRLITNGEVTGGTPACQEGDDQWLTLDDYWDAIHAETPPARRAPSPAIRVAASLPPVEHPALRPPPPLPVWRIVYGVCFLVASFSTFGWALLALLAVVKSPVENAVTFFVATMLAGAVEFGIGLVLTTPAKARD